MLRYGASMSLDGFVAGDDQSPDNPLGVRGERLHAWMRDRLTSAADDHFAIKIYAPAADPVTATPIYQVSSSLAKGNGIKIR